MSNPSVYCMCFLKIGQQWHICRALVCNTCSYLKWIKDVKFNVHCMCFLKSVNNVNSSVHWSVWVFLKSTTVSNHPCFWFDLHFQDFLTFNKFVYEFCLFFFPILFQDVWLLQRIFFSKITVLILNFNDFPFPYNFLL